jgi:hypothetical protein
MSQKFKSEVELEALNNATADTDKFLVSDGGIIKYRTGAEVRTDIGADSVSVVKHQVKAGVAINKGQAVYVTSADGTNMIVGLASNASEATSSKTMGLMASTVSTNGFGNVIAEGLLAGLNTNGATAGDPVWLGTNGNLIYGLTNKPYAPAHLVFIGIVTRVNSNNGEIFVKVQNGFELNEIHDVDLKTTTPVNGHLLGFDGTLWVNKTIAGWLGYTPQAQLNGTGFVKASGTTITYDNTSYYPSSNPSGYISSYTETDTLATVTGRGATTSSQVSFTKTDDHAISVGTIRGRAVNGQSGEYIHLYERVNIGSPVGWGSRNAPSYGLSTYGGANLATDTGYTTSGGSMRAPVFYDSEDTNFYVDPTGVKSLRIYGGIAQNNLVGRPYAVWGAGGSATGPVVIKFPGDINNYGMIHAEIDVYEYGSNAASTIIVGGHNWNGSWYNSNVQVIGQTDKPVRLGFKDGKYCIVIGNSSSSWSYGQVVLRKIQNGAYYDGVMDVAQGYTIAIESDSYTNISGDLRDLRTPLSFTAGQDIRTPIYYDSNDTGYYLNPNSSSVLNSLTVGGYELVRARTQGNWAGSGVIDNVVGLLSWRAYGSGHVIFDASASITPSGTNCNNTNPETNWTSSYPTLMGWNGSNTYGVRVDSARVADSASALSNMNISQFTNNSGYITSYTETDTLASVTGRGSSTSTLSNFNGGLTAAKTAKNTYGLQIKGGFYGAPRLQLYDLAVDSNAFVGLGVDMSGSAYEFSNYFPRYSGNGKWSVGSWAGDFGTGQYVSGYNEKLWINESSAQFNVSLTDTVDFRAPIFYDSNNTGYYIDPNGSSVLNTVTGSEFYNYGWFRNYNNNTGLYNQPNGNHIYSRGGTRWGITGNGASSDIYLDFYGNHETTYRGSVHADGNSSIGFLTNNGGWGLRVETNKNVHVHGTTLYISADGQNASNIIMKDGDEGDRQIHCNSNRIGFLTAGGSWSSYSSDNGDWTTEYISYAGASSRAPIFYDSDNTGYYTNPAGLSVLNSINTGGTGAYNVFQSWTELNGAHGFYSGVNGAHFYPNNGSYGSWKIAGTRGGYNGLEFDGLSNGLVSLMIGTDSNRTGFHNNSYGWQMYWLDGTAYVGKSSYGGGTNAALLDSVNFTNYAASSSHTHTFDSLTSKTGGTGTYQTSGDFRAPILYDSNNTGYYLNPDSGSNIKDIVGSRYYQGTDGVPTSNLGTPSITEMALFHEQFNNKTAFYNHNNLTFWTSSDGVNFTEYTGFDSTAKKRFLGGDSDSGVFIPNQTNRFRVEIENSGAYVFLNQLYAYWSSNSHSTKVQIWARRCDNNQWYQWTSSNQEVGAWPGHLYLPFNGIPFYPGALASSGHYNRIRIEFIPTWSTGAYSTADISLMRMQIWGGYPAGKRNIYTVDENQNVLFPTVLSASESSRAPAFYDSDDTTYYANLASTSDLAVRQRGGTLHGPNPTWGKYLLIGGDGRQNYTNDANVASVCTTDGNLHIDAASNKDLYLNFYDGNAVYFGSGSSSTASSIENDGSHRPQIIYDYNNTGYYLNPDSTSNLNALNLAGNLTLKYSTADTEGYNALTFAPGSDDYIIKASSTYGVFGRNSFGWHVNSASAFGVYSSGWNKIFGCKPDAVESFQPFYAPIFYDSDNTGYYIDPNSTTQINNLRLSTLDSAITWTNNTYMKGSPAHGFRFNDNGDTINAMIIDNSGNTFAYSSHRAPIFYDSNNTGYYTDPASTSSLHTLALANYLDISSHLYTRANIYTLNTAGNGWNTIVDRNGGNSWIVYGGESMRAPVFYDSNNTGYYLDSNSTSSLYNLTLSGAKNTYLHINPGNGYEAMVRYSGGSGSDWYVGKRTANDLVTTADFHLYSSAAGITVAGIDVGGNIFATQSIRTGLFYDLDDTSYTSC